MHLKKTLRELITMASETARKSGELAFETLPPFEVEAPKLAEHGDLALAPPNPQRPTLRIHVVAVDPNELAAADPGRVQRFEHCPVAYAAGRRQVGPRQYRLRLARRKHGTRQLGETARESERRSGVRAHDTGERAPGAEPFDSEERLDLRAHCQWRWEPVPAGWGGSAVALQHARRDVRWLPQALAVCPRDEGTEVRAPVPEGVGCVASPCQPSEVLLDCGGDGHGWETAALSRC